MHAVKRKNTVYVKPKRTTGVVRHLDAISYERLSVRLLGTGAMISVFIGDVLLVGRELKNSPETVVVGAFLHKMHVFELHDPRSGSKIGYMTSRYLFRSHSDRISNTPEFTFTDLKGNEISADAFTAASEPSNDREE